MLKAPSKTKPDTDLKKGNNRSGTLVLVLIGIIVCLLLILFATIFLPQISLSDSPSENKTPINKLSQKTDIKLIKEKKNSEHEIKKFNENLDIEWMLKKVDAKNNQLPVWSKIDYEKAVGYENLAKNYKKNKDYKNSELNYKKAIETINNGLSKKEIILEQLIIEATAYLENENLVEAKQIFIKAQSIDKENKIILRSLERITNRVAVIRLYNQSMEQQKKLQFDEAIEYLNKALVIEPEYKKTNKALIEIKEKKRKIDFNNKIGEILAALDKNNLSMAEDKINRAKKLNSNDAIIAELEIRVKEKYKSIEIKRLQKKAKKQEKNEQWQVAKKTYQRILKLDSNTSMAIMSQARVTAYIELNQLIDPIIENPDRLQNDKVLNKSRLAVQFVNNKILKNDAIYKVSEIPKLMQKILIAEKIISDASIIINITIKSDNETDIIIYKVAKIGKIIERNIQLRPGKYTIVGSRAGYRDYRKIFHVTANDQTIVINVQCREKI